MIIFPSRRRVVILASLLPLLLLLLHQFSQRIYYSSNQLLRGDRDFFGIDPPGGGDERDVRALSTPAAAADDEIGYDDDANDGSSRMRSNQRYRTRAKKIPLVTDDHGSSSSTTNAFDEVLPETQDAVFLVQEIEYYYNAHGALVGVVDSTVMENQRHRSRIINNTGNSQSPRHSRRDRTENLQLPDGTIYEVKNARAGWASRLKSGRYYSVQIPRDSVVDANGTIDMRNEELNVTTMRGGVGTNRSSRRPRDPRHYQRRQLQIQTVGTRTVLVVRVILDDAMYNWADPTGLSNDVFGNGVDPNNLKSQFAACSANQLLFEKTPNRVMTSNPNDGGTTDINNGVVDIKVNLSKSIGDNVIRNAVTTKINSVFGVRSPVELADHVMYCLPSGTMLGIAYAYINSWSSVFSNEWCNYVSVQMHEIGHNLGYGHSNELGTYQDQSGMMGYSYGVDDSPQMCFNAAKSWQSQWYTSKSIIVDPSADVGYCFEGSLYGIADYSNPASSVVLVKIDDSSSTDIYVAFNRKIGINSNTQEAVNQVTVVSAGGEGISYSASELLAKLGASGVWSGIIYGKTMTVHVLSINTSVSPAYAAVRISENGNPCSPPADNPIARSVTTDAPISTPGPTSSPTSIPTSTASPTSASPTTSSPSTSPTAARPSPTSKPSKPSRESCRKGKSRRCDHPRLRVRSKFKRFLRKQQ